MRVLIYSVSSGSGDVRAAAALVAALRRTYPDVAVRHFDLLKLVPAALRRSYAENYLKVINALPSVWGPLYAKADRVPQVSALASLRYFLRRLDKRALRAHAAQWRPDVIVATHFLPAQIFSEQNGKAAAPLAVAITEHDAHRLWVQPHVARYYAGSDEIAFTLAEQGVAAERIRALGIPCHPAFGGLMDEPARHRLRHLLGLAEWPERTLLLSAPQCGVAGAKTAAMLGGILSTVLKRAAPLTVLLVCGPRASVRKALHASVKVPPRCHVKFYGTVENMYDLMGVADLLVTKPNAMTTGEALARRLPMVLVSPCPGQEERNAEMLLANGCAVLARTPAALLYKVETLLKDSARLDALREGCRRLSKPQAAMEIAADVVENFSPLAGSRSSVVGSCECLYPFSSY